METNLLRPSLMMLLSVSCLTVIQLIRINGSMLLEEQLKLARSNTRTLTFYFLLLSVMVVVTSPHVDWLEYLLWGIAAVGVLIHALMVFHKPEKWENSATMFSFAVFVVIALFCLIGTF